MKTITNAVMNTAPQLSMITAALCIVLAAQSNYATPTDPYGQAVVGDNPVAFWRLNETGGTTMTDYMGSHNGTYSSSGVTYKESPFSQYTGAYSVLLDGTNGYASVPYSAALNTSHFSVEFWAQLTGITGQTEDPFGNFYRSSSAPYTYYGVQTETYTNTTNLYLMVGTNGSGGSGNFSLDGGPYVLNQWAYWAFTYDGANMSFFINGQLVSGPTNLPFLTNPSEALNIGRQNLWGTQYWKGNMEDVAMYNYALSEYQVLNHYETGMTGASAAPVITENPFSLNLYAGDTAPFSVQTSFSLPNNLSYQWMAGTIGSGVFTNLVNKANISGVTTSNLVIDSISTANAADYILVVSYPGISVTSTVATLTVQPAPGEILTDPNFSTYSGGVATGWHNNPWGNASMADNQLNGTDCQEIAVSGIASSSDGAGFYQTYTNTNGSVYLASICIMGAANNMPVQIELRAHDTDGYHYGASIITNIGTSWQQLYMIGGFMDATNTELLVTLMTNGTYYLSNASMEDVTLDYQQAPLSNAGVTIQTNFLGMHVNELAYGNYPSIHNGLMRLWDTGTAWTNLETNRNQWTWTRFDSWTNFILSNNPHCEILYTMGKTPAWARASGTSYTDPPTNIVDWSNYVWQVATRYKGTIKYYELWNEFDGNGFWTGTPAQMAWLATNAINVLRSVDPTIKVLGPNIDRDGLPFLEQYIQAGGPTPDIVTFHDYPTWTPEHSLPVIAGVRNLLSRYPAFSSLPVWCTEGASLTNTNSVPNINQEDMGIVARSYLFWWTQDVPNWNWYTWDIPMNNVPLQAYGWPCELGGPGGIAYSNLVNWLVGSQMTGKAVDTNGTWMVELQQQGMSKKSHIVWNPTNTSVNYSFPTNWGVYEQFDLSNNMTTVSGTSVTVGHEPVLLQSH